jgi:hypothetical protein
VAGYVAPQLHTHAVIFNITEREDGQPRAIQPQSLFDSQQLNPQLSADVSKTPALEVDRTPSISQDLA